MSNSLTNASRILIVEGLRALRENAVMAALVNRDYQNQAATPNQKIQITVSSAATVGDVTPSHTPSAANTSVAPTVMDLVLDQWKYSDFALTDREVMEMQPDVLPGAAAEAIKALANTVDKYLLGLGQSFFGYYAPDGAIDLSDLPNLKKVLSDQLCPVDQRRLVVSTQIEAEMLSLSNYVNADNSGDTMALREGSMGRRVGFNIYADQNVSAWTKGTASGVTASAHVNSSKVAVGDTTIDLDKGDQASLTGTIKVGDVFTVAGDAQTYVVRANAASPEYAAGVYTAAANVITKMAFYPAAKVAWADNAKLSLKASHTPSLAFHRDAITFAMRPLSGVAAPGSLIQTISDEISGIALRLEVTRQNAQNKYRYDILYGGLCVRPEFGARLADE